MAVTRFEVLHEYVFSVKGLDHKVKGRVLRELAEEPKEMGFRWEISHYCKPSEDAASIYIPSVSLATTAEEAEYLLMRYAREFTTIGVRANAYY